jgi:hypothetical protein
VLPLSPQIFGDVLLQIGDDRFRQDACAEGVAFRVSARMDSLKKSVQTINAEDNSYAMAA